MQSMLSGFLSKKGLPIQHLTDNEKEIPEQVNKWKDICMNPDEFDEVSNQWRVY